MNVNALYGESDAMTRLFELGQRRAEYEKSQKERTQYAATGAGSAYSMWAKEQAAQASELLASGKGKYFTQNPKFQEAGFLKRSLTPVAGRVDITAAGEAAGATAPKGITGGQVASGLGAVGEIYSLAGPEAKHLSDKKKAIKTGAALAHTAAATGLVQGTLGMAMPWLGAGLSLWGALGSD